MNCGSNKNVLMRNLSFVTWRSWSLFFGKRWDLKIFAEHKFSISQLMIWDPLQRPFLRWFVTAQLWLNLTWQSLHLNGLPSSPWWSFSCLRAAFVVVKPFLHLVQLNSLVKTLVGWHLELFCNIDELNFPFIWLLIWSSPRAKRAGPKGERARAVTVSQCPHSEVGQDFLLRRRVTLTETAVTRKRKV